MGPYSTPCSAKRVFDGGSNRYHYCGGIDHVSTAGSPTIGELHGIGGQPGTVGVSTGLNTGIRFEGGFHPAIRFVPEPSVLLGLAAGITLLRLLARRRRVGAELRGRPEQSA